MKLKKNVIREGRIQGKWYTSPLNLLETAIVLGIRGKVEILEIKRVGGG
jgi:hypothetical protein